MRNPPHRIQNLIKECVYIYKLYAYRSIYYKYKTNKLILIILPCLLYNN